MFTPKAHIIVIDGKENSGRNMLCFELALVLLYNAQKTAIVLSNDSPLQTTIKKRLNLLPQLLTPTIITKDDFYNKANDFSAVLIPHISVDDPLALTATTYITLLAKHNKETPDVKSNNSETNKIFELKKKIAATYNRSLDWIVCENNFTNTLIDSPSEKLKKDSNLCGYRLAPPINQRLSYQNNTLGISAQDKSLPMFQKDMTYEDICTKKEIIKLAEFIFS